METISIAPTLSYVSSSFDDGSSQQLVNNEKNTAVCDDIVPPNQMTITMKVQPVGGTSADDIDFSHPEKPISPTKETTDSTTSPTNYVSFLSRLFSFTTSSSPTNKIKRPPPPVAKGVYAVIDNAMQSESQKTLDTHVSTGSSSEKASEGPSDIWSPSIDDAPNKGVPLVVRRPKYDSYNETDDTKLLKLIMKDAKKLPKDSGKYASNHVMINGARIQRNIPPLTRDRHMDQVARDHAKYMADSNKVCHMEDGPFDLQNRILKVQQMEDDTIGSSDESSSDFLQQQQSLYFKRLGVNIAKGKSIDDIHKFMMATLAERNNILDRRFSMMGVGTARSSNGTIFLCQVFGG